MEGTTDDKGSVERPAWLPEKFETPEAMAASYAELETKLGQMKPAEEDKNKSTEDDKSKEAKIERPSYEKIDEELAATGTVSEETLALYEKAGIPAAILKGYAEGKLAAVNAVAAKLYEAVDGEENYNAMLGYMQYAATDDEITAFNTAVSKGSVEDAIAAASAAYDNYVAKTGAPPRSSVSGRTGSNGEAFSSRAESIAAMNDPRYTSDPAYRDAVIKKTLASKF